MVIPPLVRLNTPYTTAVPTGLFSVQGNNVYWDYWVVESRFSCFFRPLLCPWKKAAVQRGMKKESSLY